MTENGTLITGAQGFCGRHLVADLIQCGYSVSGIDLAPSKHPAEMNLYVGDIRDSGFVQHVVASTRPTSIFHLGAVVAPDAEMALLHEVNVRGTENLLEAVRTARLDPVILIAGSSAVYGHVAANELPIRESQPFRPANAYAVSKIAQEMVAYVYYARYDVRVIRTRAFNLVGPGQPSTLACSAWAEQVARIEAGHSAPVLQVGDLDTWRDLVDVRDVVRAYRLATQQGLPGEVYNVCSGRAVQMRSCLDSLLKLSRIPIRVELDRSRMRLSDVRVSVGDGSLFHKQTGWRPIVSLVQSLADQLDDWRRQVREVSK